MFNVRVMGVYGFKEIIVTGLFSTPVNVTVIPKFFKDAVMSTNPVFNLRQHMIFTDIEKGTL